MRSGAIPPSAVILPDGHRLHLHHGPIDLIIGADGVADAVARSHDCARRAFADVLPTLSAELSVLRKPLEDEPPDLRGPVARRMLAACWPHRSSFVTPMAAVAGAVADHILQHMLTEMASGANLKRAYVNNGGDIAFHLAAGERLRCAVVGDPSDPAVAGVLTLGQETAARGLATSGRATKGSGGRSFSLGIADAVTVLAATAADADVAATLIANAVDLADHPAIVRVPAVDLDPDSDLGSRAVTLDVGPLSVSEIARALDGGASAATLMLESGLIDGAVLVLHNRIRVIGEQASALLAAPLGALGMRRHGMAARYSDRERCGCR